MKFPRSEIATCDHGFLAGDKIPNSPQRVDWQNRRALPHAVRQALRALSFTAPDSNPFQGFHDEHWKQLLTYCDYMKVTLAIANLRRGDLPDWVRARTERDLANNVERHLKQWAAWDEIDGKLRHAGVEHLLLKGFSHGSEYLPSPGLRHQSDLDLYQRPEDSAAAERVLRDLGYEPIGDFRKFPMDHLPAMVRKSAYQWKGDFYDPNVPVAVELHFRWWDAQTEGFPAPGLDAFWKRRVAMRAEGREFLALRPQDRITYAALHALRHLLRGDVRLLHFYEIAHFLHATAADAAFWELWRTLTASGVRRYCSTLFETVRLWFGCSVPEIIQAETETLKPAVRVWLRDYAASPVENRFRPNKDELWLHLALLPPESPRAAVIGRRLLPRNLPAPVAGVTVPNQSKSLAQRIREGLAYAAHFARRAGHHARSLLALGAAFLPGTLGHRGLSAPFWIYLIAASFHHLGIFVFVLLYNLHLRDLGHDEAFIGLTASAMTAGSIVAAVPGGRLARRIGLRRALLIALAAVPLAGAVRALVRGETAILTSAFGAGLLFSLWVVCIAPTIASLVPAASRPRAFSIFFASSIALGVLGGAIGGRLPGLLDSLGLAAAWTPNQLAILAGCAISSLALVPGFRLGGFFPEIADPAHRPSGPFIRRFLAAVFLWNLAIGAFNPFFNVYFAGSLKLPVDRLGDLFAAGQFAQVGALLLAPLVLARLGNVSAIAVLQGLAGVALALLAIRQPLWLPVLAYLLYMSFQWMSEPGLHNLLMGQVSASERTTASSLNYLTAFSAHAIAAAAAGAAIARWDYATVLTAAAAIAILAGCLFRWTLTGFDNPAPPAASNSSGPDESSASRGV